MSSPAAGWYTDPTDTEVLRYWDGSSWTEKTAPLHPPVARHATPVIQIPVAVNPYHEAADLSQLLTPEQREQCKQHNLTKFPVWLAVVLHFLTIGLFTLIYHGQKLSRLPIVKHDDFRAGKGIGFCFIPFFSLYWVFRYVLAVTDRLNFQFRLRDQRPPVPRGLALASCIVWLIPYVNVIAWVILMPIVSGQWQAAANKLVKERDGV